LLNAAKLAAKSPKKGIKMPNTRRMNRLEELGRVDAEKAMTAKGKRNLADEKKRIVGEMKMARGGMAKMTKSEAPSKMGKVKTSPKPDGVAVKGKTKGTMVKMARGGDTKMMRGGGISMMARGGMPKMRGGGKC
jgi:hypothetical protein